MTLMSMMDQTSTMSFPQNAGPVRHGTCANVFHCNNGITNIFFIYRRFNAGLFAHNRFTKGTYLRDGRRDFVLFKGTMRSLTTGQRIAPAITYFPYLGNILAVGSRMTTVPMTSLQLVNSMLQGIYYGFYGLTRTRRPLVFNTKIRRGTIGMPRLRITLQRTKGIRIEGRRDIFSFAIGECYVMSSVES